MPKPSGNCSPACLFTLLLRPDVDGMFRNPFSKAPSSGTPAAPPPAVPAGTVVYAIGDIHGRADLLSDLHRQIAADAGQRGAERRVVVYLGDYVDRGAESAG